MVETRCNRCTKHTIILLAIISMLNGLIMIIAGTVHSESSADNPPAVGTRSMVIGMVLLIIPPIGIYGILQKKWTIMLIFALIFIVGFFITLSLGINLVTSTDKYEPYYNDYLAPKYEEARRTREGSEEIQRIHAKYSCCGLTGPHGKEVLVERILKSGYKHTYVYRIFRSCCETIKNICRRDDDDVRRIGCIDVMSKDATYIAGLAGIYVIVSSILFLYIALFFLSLSWQTKHAEVPPPELEEYEDEYYEYEEEYPVVPAKK